MISIEWVAGALAVIMSAIGIVFRLIMRQRIDLSDVKNELSGFKEKVAETYAPREYLDKIEQRIIEAMRAMEYRLEKRIDNVSKGIRK